ELLAYLAKRKKPPYIYTKERRRFLVVGDWHRPMVSGIDLDAKLAAKDAVGIQLTALSTNDPGPEQFGAEGPPAARMSHDSLDEHPKLKLVCPHVGGTLPYLIGRIDHQVTVLKRVKVALKQRPSEYLRTIYLDAVNALPAVIRFGIDLVGPERMLFSSDHPWVEPKLIIDNVRSLKLPAEQEAMLFAGNARKLFNL